MELGKRGVIIVVVAAVAIAALSFVSLLPRAPPQGPGGSTTTAPGTSFTLYFTDATTGQAIKSGQAYVAEKIGENSYGVMSALGPTDSEGKVSATDYRDRPEGSSVYLIVSGGDQIEKYGTYKAEPWTVQNGTFYFSLTQGT